MAFYQINLACFVATNAYLLYRQYQKGRETADDTSQDSKNIEQAERQEDAGAARRFQFSFFLPYALAVAADWLQGPHIYAIYKYEKNIAEKTVAALYAAGFVSGGISASFAGGFADKFGRKRACLLYCGLYILTCLTMLTDNLIILFLGRLCGGVCTTLLFSVFETWLISDYHDRGLDASKLDLSSVFGNMTTLSCIVAIASGVFGDILVQISGTRTWPFMAAAFCCVGAAYLMATTWKENYGVKTVEQTSLQDIKSGVLAIVQNPKILSLSITSCFFEGTMYLFIFFWSAALKSARALSGSSEDLPFGLIFSSFMCAMMAGSAIFSLRGTAHSARSTSELMENVTLIVSACLLFAAVLQNEILLFWAFCLLEGCVGAYFPSMAFLKSEMIEDGVRGRVYSILRFPLNVFVVVTHSLDEEGDAHRNHVFLVCATLLLGAYIMSRRQFGWKDTTPNAPN
ncbi:major facilitator superfamily domain-containing protein [Xylariales sp. PMI_506]|nr:major facilitator superfamily domain-containing protein [Xylariales sp. PMI_506]